MLEKILKLYVMYMAYDVRSPTPHLFGPPGCGKSTVVQQLATLVSRQLHIINVSRISPLELEGVQMPHGTGEEMILRMLPATFWTQLEEGDILLLDEFLRGFPEVYNGLLDILTSRRVGAFVLPKVFIIAASNTTVSYDKALEDRLLHLTVPDIRKNKAERKRVGKMLIDELGLLPEMVDSAELEAMLQAEVVPMYEILDSLKNKSSSPAMLRGSSIRNLIGQAKLREIESSPLRDLLDWNNRKAIQQGKHQFVFLPNGKNVDPQYLAKAKQIQEKASDKLSEVQKLNLQLNLQLIELESIRHEKEDDDDDNVTDPDPFA